MVYYGGVTMQEYSQSQLLTKCDKKYQTFGCPFTVVVELHQLFSLKQQNG